MSNLKHYIEVYDAFIKKEMNEAEEKSFREKVTSDEEFAQGFKEYQKALIAIKTAGIREEAGHGLEDQSRSDWQVVGLLLVACLGLIVFFNYQSHDSSEQIFNQYFSAYPNITLKRTNDNHVAVLDHYSMEQYDLVIEKLEGKLQSDTLRFYFALAHLASDNTSQAIQHLNAIDHSSVFHKQVMWYLALAHLKQSSEDSSMYYLNRIQKGGYKYNESQEILDLVK